jgi:hypothetical protein
VASGLSVDLGETDLRVLLKECPGRSVSSAIASIKLALRTDNRSATTAPGNPHQTIDSPAAFEALPLPPASAYKVLALAMATSSPLAVRLTFQISAQAVIPVRGLLLLEAPADDRITLVEVQGQGTLSWLLTGD